MATFAYALTAYLRLYISITFANGHTQTNGDIVSGVRTCAHGTTKIHLHKHIIQMSGIAARL